MAKEAQKVNKNNNENEEEIEEATKVASSDDIQPTQKQVYDPYRKVTVVPKVSGRKRIGNEWYELEEGVEKEVPHHVKKVLREADAIRL